MQPELDGDLAEYVLGTLPAEARARIARAMAADADMRDAADRWAAWFADLEPLVRQVDPSPAVWREIEAALDRAPAVRPLRPSKPSPWDSLGFWRGFGLATAAAAAVLLVVVSVLLYGQFVAPTGKSELIAVLNGQSGEPALVVSAAGRGDSISVRPVAPIVTDDRVLELWMIAPGRPSPVSLGLLDSRAAVSLPAPDVLHPREAGKIVLAVSLEPPGGSPVAGPTGPVLFQGPVIRPTP